MAKKNVVFYELSKAMYEHYDCFECNNKAAHRLGIRDENGEGYNTKALCKSCYSKYLLKVEHLIHIDNLNELAKQHSDNDAIFESIQYAIEAIYKVVK